MTTQHPRKTRVFTRYAFQKRKQADESFDTFVTDLRNLAKDCQYDKSDEMVRDKIASGVKSQAMREKLLTEDDFTMDRVIEIAVTYETTQQRFKSLAAGSSTADSVDVIKKQKYHKNRRHSGADHTQALSTAETVEGRMK